MIPSVPPPCVVCACSVCLQSIHTHEHTGTHTKFLKGLDYICMHGVHSLFPAEGGPRELQRTGVFEHVHSLPCVYVVHTFA